MLEKLDRYEILEEIGRGGFAVVYRARDTKLKRPVALKELRQGFLNDREWVRRFEREAQTIAHLDHGRIVTIHDVLELDQRLFIVMRLIEGPSLEEVIANQGAIPWSQTVEISTVVAEGLDYAHRKGILHRDLKPANILLDPDRGPLLTDFGLAKLVSEGSTSVTAAGAIVGTPHYIAPEVWEGQGTTPQSDIYALGCILHEMLTGEKLFQGEAPPAVMMSHFNPPMLPETWPQDVPAGVADILKKSLAKQPDERYASAGEMVEALTGLAEAELKATEVGDILQKSVGPVEVMPATATAQVKSQKRQSDDQGVAEKAKPGQVVVGELRVVTVLSARLSGAIDVEDVLELTNRLLMIIEEVQVRYEAQIDRLLGEEVLAVFGTPQAHEDDHERALWAALEIHSEAQKQGLRVTIGINTGDVYFGRTTSERYQGGTIMGPVVNLTSRLVDASEPGEIIVGPDTYRLTAPLFDFEALEPITMKAIAEPVSAYRLLGAKPVRGKARGLVGLESPLVGRETELGALQEVVKRLQAGMGGIVTLVGEAGLGKSRLVAELQQQILVKIPDELQVQPSSPGRSAVQWVEGRCLSFGGSIAYLLWLDVLRGLLGVTAEDAPSAVRDALRERVETLCADFFDDVFPHLARLLSLSLPDEVEAMLRGLGSKGLKFGTFRAAEILIESTARLQRPLIVVCEDLHWADPTSLELLEQLLSLTDRAPVLFICLFRPETEHGCWRIKETAARQFRHRHIDLWLESLSAVESTRLVDNLLRREELPPELAERILNRAEGNPFYVEEIVRSLIDAEDIVWDETTGRWQVVSALAEIAIPDTLRGVLTARIDRLQDETKRVLQLAAVIGRVFFYRVLEAIARQEHELSSHLSTLQREEMIRERTRIPELEYIFKHQLTQEATYRGLLRKDRRLFHRQTAEALESLFPERIEEQVELLAHHWEQAGASEKATEYLVKAGQKAAGRYANTEALAYFQRALALAEGQAGHDAILTRRAKVLLDMFQGREAAKDYQQLHDRAGQSGNRKGVLEALLGLAAAYYVIALDEPDIAAKSLKLYEQAYLLAGELADKASMVRALISTRWFANFWPEYRQRAVANIEEAWAISQELGDEELSIDCMIARSHYDLVSIEQVEELLIRLESGHDLPRLKEAYFRPIWRHLFTGNFERCVECCQASIKLAVKLGAPPVMYSTMKALALVQLGRYQAAWQALQEEIANDEYPFGRALKDFGRGMYLLELMAYRRAAAVFEDTIEQAKRMGRAWLSVWAQAELSKTQIRRDRSDEVNLDWITQDLETDIALTADVPAVLGEIALIKGDLDEALRQAEQACAEAEERNWRPAYVSALELQVRVLLKLDRARDVIPLAGRGIQMAEEMAYQPLLWRLRTAKAQALAQLGDTGQATPEYEAAAAVIGELVDTIGDAQLKRSFMSNTSVLSVLEWGQASVGGK